MDHFIDINFQNTKPYASKSEKVQEPNEANIGNEIAEWFGIGADGLAPHPVEFRIIG